MFVGDIFMPPDDPLGRNGPTLDQFLTCASFAPNPSRNVCTRERGGQYPLAIAQPPNVSALTAGFMPLMSLALHQFQAQSGGGQQTVRFVRI